MTRQPGDAAAWPSGRTGHEHALDRRPVARVARERPEDEVLAQMVAAGDAVATYQVGVVGLEIERRQDRALEYQVIDPRRVLRQLCDHSIRVGLLRRRPVSG